MKSVGCLHSAQSWWIDGAGVTHCDDCGCPQGCNLGQRTVYGGGGAAPGPYEGMVASSGPGGEGVGYHPDYGAAMKLGIERAKHAEEVDRLKRQLVDVQEIMGRKMKELKMASVLHEWVIELPLRYQGVLLSAVRGCDTAPKNDPSKLLARVFRAVILKSPAIELEKTKPTSFMEILPPEDVASRMEDFVRYWDQYPMHYVMHMAHAAQIVGYKHPDTQTAALWGAFYTLCCDKMHVAPETPDQLKARLEAPERLFEKAQKETIDLKAVARAVKMAAPKEVRKRCLRCGEIVCNCRFSGT